jgi:hypothetical protein
MRARPEPGLTFTSCGLIGSVQKETARFDPRIEVVNLRPTRGLEHVQSNQREPAVTVATIIGDEFGLHDAEIDLERQRRVRVRREIRAHADAVDYGVAEIYERG